MAEENNSNPDPVVPETPAVAPSYSGPTKEEFDALQNSIREMQTGFQAMQEFYSAPEETFNQDEIDLNDPRQLVELIDYVTEQKMRNVTPYVRNAAKDQGERQLNSMLEESEVELKNEFPDGFDKTLAKRAAFAIFDETGDAQEAVKQAARYAAETRATERAAAEESYRKKASRGRAFSDPGVDESGVEALPKAKTYDEVLERWSQQTEL
jgi:hypothetical protein